MQKRKLAIGIFGVAAACSLLFGGLCFESVSAKELPTTTLENEKDGFLLSEKSYAAEESFVYTTTAYFESGQAAALVFGASETETEKEYWAFNVDRTNNLVKLLYFYETEEQSFTAVELLVDYYIGNDKMTDGEKSLVNPKVAQIDKVQLKVIVSAEEDGKVYAEFYADNIRRFGVDNEYELNGLEKLPEGVRYEGGFIGFNCFNAKIRFEDTYYATSDYSYYTEIYRQQYHFSQYAHWNNDPNGLVYYDGWYHAYYQHHPFSNYWSDMYWGHARSRDLVHWELLPICLFPDTEVDGWGGGNGYMWSGSAMVYRKGMSDKIDSLNWYPNGNGEGLIAFYTRDGGLQDQVVMSSDDGGMTWTKRVRIPQTLIYDGGKTDCRDPKVFPVKEANGKVTLWGMALTGMATGDVWFLKSENLVDWSFAGGFKTYTIDVNRNFRSECPDVVTLEADDGTKHTVMSFTGRTYMVGDIVYDETTGTLKFIDLNGNDVSKLSPDEQPLERMDFGPDSYATQSFYIDDPESKYFGEVVSMSWFSGIPGGAASIESGSLAALRETWNGGGLTIPVKWGLVKKGARYVLSQTPIVKGNEDFDKTELLVLEDQTVDPTSENVLKDVASRTLELSAEIENPNGATVKFKLQYGDGKYTEVGWTEEDGYYVDRTYSDDGGLSMPNYRVRYVSGKTDSKTLSFYVLVDQGSVEVFCDGYTYPFYVLTFASPTAMKATFETDGEVTLNRLTANAIASVWRDGSQTDGGDTLVYLSEDEVELSMQLSKEKEIGVYTTSGESCEWSFVSGEGTVALETTAAGVRLRALKQGEAVLLAKCGTVEKEVSVKVYDGAPASDLSFRDDGVISGNWLMTSEGIVGSQTSGDGFLLSETVGGDFTLVAGFDIGDGAAAALMFRAKADMSDYYIANYDKNGGIVKLWTPLGELANVRVEGVDPSKIVMSVTAKGNRITVSVNGNQVVDVIDEREDAPTEGLFGLNVCATRATFTSVGLQRESYSYAGGTLTVKGALSQAITAVYNESENNAKIDRSFYEVVGREIRIKENYFATLAETGEYRLKIVGKQTSFSVTVTVSSLPSLTFEDLALQQNCNANFYVGETAIEYVSVNGVRLTEESYAIQGGILTVYASAFRVGENSLSIGEIASVTVTVTELARSKEEKSGCGSVTAIAPTLALAAGVLTLVRRKKYGNDD